MRDTTRARSQIRKYVHVRLSPAPIAYTYRYVQTLLIVPFDPAAVNCIIIETFNYYCTAHIKRTDITQGRSHKMRTLTPRIVRRSYTLSETGGLGLGQTTATVGGTRCMPNTYRYVQTIRGGICITSSPLALAIRRAACVASHTAHAEACLSVVQACLSVIQACLSVVQACLSAVSLVTKA